MNSFRFLGIDRTTQAWAVALLATLLASNVASAESFLRSDYGRLPDGTAIDQYKAQTSTGMEIAIINYGCIITHLIVPDRNGEGEDIVHGMDDLEGYLSGTPYFGCVVGRYGNRIAFGKFAIDGKEYTLATNNDANHLHGGEKGFDKVAWTAVDKSDESAFVLELSYLSKDGEEGYPGNLSNRVTYRIPRDKNEIHVDYHATTDKATPINLTQHSYFNLEGPTSDSILDHKLMLACDRFTPVNAGLIPLGELRSVAGTPMDFREPTAIGLRIDKKDTQLERGLGYDHNWVLSGEATGGMRLAAKLMAPKSGRTLEIHTTEPGIQFYSGNFLDGTVAGKDKKKYQHRSALCLETQHYPDSPNQPNFPSTILRPGDTYSTHTVFRFSTSGR